MSWSPVSLPPLSHFFCVSLCLSTSHVTLGLSFSAYSFAELESIVAITMILQKYSLEGILGEA